MKKIITVIALVVAIYNYITTDSHISIIIAPAVAAAGVAALAQGGQIYASAKMNKKTREWNEKMYGIQRADALKDWQSQNDYNSPAAQMQRFKDAGLNPNLIYGQQNEGATVRSTDVKQWSPQAPDIAGFGRVANVGLQNHYDTQVKQAQIDNMAVQQKILNEEVALRKAQTAATIMSTAKSDQQIANMQEQNPLIRQQHDLLSKKNFQMGELNNIYSEFAKEQLRQLSTSTDLSIRKDHREGALAASSIRQGVANILRMESQNATDSKMREKLHYEISNVMKEGSLKQYEIDLNNMGLEKGDKVKYIKMIADAILKKLAKD